MASATALDGFEVLLVDDDELLCERLACLLDRRGIRSISVHSLQMASEAMRAVYFPVVVLDRQLGDGDGLALCRDYRLRQAERKVSILVLSILDSAEEAKFALDAGADAFLSKRSSEESVLDRVEQLYEIAAQKAPRPWPFRGGGRHARILSDYGIADTPAEQAYDDIVRIAASVCRMPLASLTFVDEKRSWFKAQLGLTMDEAPREHTFCSYAVQHPKEVSVVCDTTTDARFANNPFVVGEPFIRFYAGAPLVTRDHQVLGTVCVMDTQPRKLDGEAIEALRALSRQAVQLMEQRRLRRRTEQRLKAQRALEVERRRTTALFNSAFDHAPMGMAIVSTEGQLMRINEALSHILGYTQDALLHASLQSLCAAEEYDVPAAQMQELLAGAIESFDAHLRLRHRRGYFVSTRVHLAAVREDGGHTPYFIAHVQSAATRQGIAPRTARSVVRPH